MRPLRKASPPKRLNLSVVKGSMAICRMKSCKEIPQWVVDSPFYAVTRTEDELSVVCPEGKVPKQIKSDRGWRCLKIRGPIALSEVGILASLTRPLAESRISVFAISTFDTDYLLVKKKDFLRAIRTLGRVGHPVEYYPCE